jgi:hypothetical protein
MKAVCLALLLLSPLALPAKEKQPASYSIPIPPPPDFSPFAWLVGNWTGQTAGNSPQGALHFSAAYDLGKRIMVLREKLALDATKTTPATNETWMGILSPGPSASSFVLELYSTAGFVSRYQVTVDGPSINIVPAGGLAPPPGMLFRRIIQRTEDGGFTETVQVAPPARPFFDYYTAKFVRETPTSPPAPEAPSQ